VYNNPLGVFNIIKVPNFKYKTIDMTNTGVDPNDPNGPNGYNYTFYDFVSFGQPFMWNPNNTSRKPFDDVYDYKLAGPISYALNPASRLAVKSIDAAYVLEYPGDSSLLLKHNGRQWWHTVCGNCAFIARYSSPPNLLIGPELIGNTRAMRQVPYFKFNGFESVEYLPYYDIQNNSPSSIFFNGGLQLPTVIDRLKNEELFVEDKTQNYSNPLGGNGSDQYIRFRTKYVPLETLHNLDFILMGSQNYKPTIYLKLFCKFAKVDKPNDEPVTMILTYDISGKLQNAQPDGTGGSGSYNYYNAKDNGTINTGNPPNTDTPKPGDYAHFGGLNITTGAYPNVLHSTTNAININSNNSSNGNVTQNNINVPNSTILPNTSVASGQNDFVAGNDINVGDNVNISANATNQLVTQKAGNNINIGRGLITGHYGNNSKVVYFAANNITIDDIFTIGNTNSASLKMYAGNDIYLNSAYQNSTFTQNNIFFSSITTSSLYAKNQIEIRATNNTLPIIISGESEFSTKRPIPKTSDMLRGDDGETDIVNMQADNAELATLCGNNVINNRSAKIDTTSKDSTAVIIVASQDSLTSKKLSRIGQEPTANNSNSNNDLIRIYPNPTTQDLNINMFLTNGGSYNLILEEIAGKILLTQQLTLVAGYSISPVNLSGITNGMYVLKIIDENNVLIRAEKIVLQR
jgi:hypothetical protein